MIRFIILFGFTYLFMHLHLTGDISKYINMKYSYLSFSMIFVLGFLTVYQLYRWNTEGNGKPDPSELLHDHSHGNESFLKRAFVYTVLLFPIVTGVFLPIATLNSNIVKAKGFHFAMIDNDKDKFSNHEILRPDTSLYYGTDAYQKMISKDKKKYTQSDSVNLDDDNFLRGLEIIYSYPGNFVNKSVSMDGFVYHGDSLKKNQLFLFRFGIIHCIADAGVFGMMVDLPTDAAKYKDDDWLHVEGTLSTVYYQPFKQTIPYLKVTKIDHIQPPKAQYVYRKS